VLPERIGKYVVQRQLGEGATSVVLQGHDPFAERTVAVKLFRSGPMQAGRLRGADRVAFLNEAKLVGKLNHPHIVALLDAAAESDHAYVIMEFVPGGTLAKYAGAERLLPVEKVVEVAFKISRALEYAHRQGVIHRDIKPSNVLVTDSLDVKVSDFGIAILRDATHTHLMHAGTPAYVAPEQLSSEPSTQQSDIYSLGVLMYQLLTGRLPFNASSHASLMYQIVNHEPPTPRTLRRDLPEALEVIVLRALQKEPAARQADWAELSDELTRFTKTFVAPRDTESDARRFQALRTLRFFQDFSDVEVWEALRIAQWRNVGRLRSTACCNERLPCRVPRTRWKPHAPQVWRAAYTKRPRSPRDVQPVDLTRRAAGVPRGSLEASVYRCSSLAPARSQDVRGLRGLPRFRRPRPRPETLAAGQAR